MSDPEQDFWLESLEKYPPEAIKDAFHEYLRKASFFPKPAEILEILRAGQAARMLKLDEQEQQAARALEEQLRAEGKIKTFKEWQDEDPNLAELVKTVDEKVTMGNYPWLSEERRNELKAKLARYNAGKVPIESSQPLEHGTEISKPASRERTETVAPSRMRQDSEAS